MVYVCGCGCVCVETRVEERMCGDEVKVEYLSSRRLVGRVDRRSFCVCVEL